MQTIVQPAGNRLVATHYGLYQTVAGIGTAGLAQAHELPAMPFLALADLGAVCAWALHRLRRNTVTPSTIGSDMQTPMRSKAGAGQHEGRLR